MLYFENDYCEGAHEEILSAREKIRAACSCPEADVFFVSGGTQANVIVIAAMLRRYEGVVAAVTGHIHGHEAGAVEYTGHKVLALPQTDGKLSVRRCCAGTKGSWRLLPVISTAMRQAPWNIQGIKYWRCRRRMENFRPRN